MKSAIVTGSSHGVGAAVLKRLAHDGFGVVVNNLSGPDGADALAAEVQKAGDLLSLQKPMCRKSPT